MISSTLLYLLYLVVLLITAPLRLLPDVSLPADVLNSITIAGTYINSMDFILPVSTFFTIFALFLAIEGFIILWKVINWTLKKIPTIS
jgi:hypothetical protein